MSKFWVITKDVYRKNVRSISFIIMLLVPFIAAAGLYIINQVTDNATEEGDTIGVVVQGDSDLLNTVEVQTVLDSMTVLNSKEQGEEQLKEEEIDGLLLLSVEKEQINGEFYSSNTMPQVTMALNQQLNQLQSSLRAKALGLSEEEVASLNASVPFSVQKITFNENGEMNTEEDFTSIRLVVGMATTILLFIFIVTYASIIAQEIASEKGTRIMEVILSSVSARSHFYGKLAGILLVALTQIVV